MYDVGTIFGALCLGYITDKMYSRRAPAIVISLIIATFVCVLLAVVNGKSHVIIYGVIVFLLGFFMGGVACIISGTAVADLVC